MQVQLQIILLKQKLNDNSDNSAHWVSIVLSGGNGVATLMELEQ